MAWFYLFFFITGATGLIYETTFARQLQLVFGSTLSAVSVVVAVFFGGMALGAALLGKYADRFSPIRFYGILEIGSGLLALLAAFLVPQIRNLYAHLYPLLPASGYLRTGTQGVLTVILLLPPTLLIGATLPALSRGLTVSFGKRFTRIGALYGLNTLGAAFGTILCGFLLLEHLGYGMSILSAALVNISIGLIALILAPRFATAFSAAKQGRSKRQRVPRSDNAASKRPNQQKGLSRLILLLAGLSGLAALGYEIVWFRILSFSVVVDAYAFALMLGVYLLGIGGGSLVAAWRFRRSQGSLLELGLLEVALSIFAVVGFIGLILLKFHIPQPVTGDPNFWWKELVSTSLLAIILILPATLIMGYVFPMLVSLYTSRKDRLGAQVGKVVAVNTLGAIVGSIISGFIFIPLVGIQKSLILFAGLSGVVGIIALTFGPMQTISRTLSLVFSVPLIVLSFLLVPLRSDFGFLQIPGHKKAQLLYYRESADQTVMVTRDVGGRKIQRLILNQQQATSTSLPGQRKNQLLGHLPLWACPDARTALVICFGSGGTFGALGAYDLERVDCVEICPAVIEAAHLFSRWNGDVLSKPNVRVIVDDGRSYLLTTQESYDIITLEPMHPGLKGVSSLYSLEFYMEARNRLRPGGVLCQWIPLYGMNGEDARSLIATATEIFPQSSLWLVGAEGILVCARDSLFIGWDWLQKKFGDGEVQAVLRQVRLEDPWAILSGYLLGPEGLRDFVQGAPIVRDDRPFTEYSIPRHKHIFPWDEMLTLVEKRESPMAMMKGVSKEEIDSLESLWTERKNVWVDRDRGFAAFSQGDMPRARRYLEAAYQQNPSDRYTAHFLEEVYWKYGLRYGRQGLVDDAVEAYRMAAHVEPRDPESHFYLAVALANVGQRQEAVKEARITLELEPEHRGAKSLLDRQGSNR
ncbi:tetratricopeptide repeat protein [candidate division TA06 bacterium]|uniref:Tetratricopeptide repeat protein n=1 Tax=candidate division TA06 bacterium TaxID=2250710 RepID=A0A523UYT3_UNCT6|nr:MAG: tetratricopeptide repeat protein [candidate division TA06 bacterium]